jgi:hypothetical protein
VAGSTPPKVAQDADINSAYSKQCTEYGNQHIAYHTQQAQQISAAVDTLGDVHGEFKDTWHQVTKPAYLAAHTSLGQAWISQGQKAGVDAVAFPDTEQANANLIGSVSAEGSAGVATPNGIPT